MRFLYVMDPMCGWCYGFQPELEQFLEEFPSAEVSWVMGGLAPDNDEPMDDTLKQAISSYWHQIESKAQVTFNHDYWQRNTPYRSTYPACRAVITAEILQPQSAKKMAKAIQSAYYLQAKNPSLEATLIECAQSIGIDESAFVSMFKSKDVEQAFQHHLAMSRQLQVQGFPALFYVNDNNTAYPLAMGFTPAKDLAQRLSQIPGAVKR